MWEDDHGEARIANALLYMLSDRLVVRRFLRWRSVAAHGCQCRMGYVAKHISLANLSASLCLLEE
jgi:hypothetical protein